MSPDQVKAAEIFRKFLLSGEQQSLLVQNGLRPANPQAPLGSPLEAACGANPAAKLVNIEMPDTLVFDRVREVWYGGDEGQVLQSHIVVMQDAPLLPTDLIPTCGRRISRGGKHEKEAAYLTNP